MKSSPGTGIKCLVLMFHIIRAILTGISWQRAIRIFRCGLCLYVLLPEKTLPTGGLKGTGKRLPKKALFGVLIITTGQMRTQLSRPIILRSEEHTSELQSRENLVCRLLLEKK